MGRSILFQKELSNDVRHKRFRLAILVCSVGIVAFAVWDFNQPFDPYEEILRHRPTTREAFSRDRWLSDVRHRYEMVDSLMKDTLGSLTTADAVFGVLSKPDRSWIQGGCSNVTYVLGTHEDFPPRGHPHSRDIWYLQITFSNNVVVTNCITST